MRNFSTGERIEPSEPTAIQTSPAAPRPLASSINRSSSLREDDPAPGAASALITPPSPSTFANALKAVGEDRAEVDELHAVAQVGLVGAVPVHHLAVREAREGRRDLAPAISRTMLAYSGSISAIRSSSVTNDISTSS